MLIRKSIFPRCHPPGHPPGPAWLGVTDPDVQYRSSRRNGQSDAAGWAGPSRDGTSPLQASAVTERERERERRSDLWPAIRPSTTTIYVVQTTEILSTGVNYAYMLCFCYLHLSRQYCSDYNSIITRKWIFTNTKQFDLYICPRNPL